MVVNVTNATVTLSWTPPATTNGIITQYQIQYRRSDSSSDFDSLNMTNDDLTYTITELTSDTEYVFRVIAFTAVGHGSPSNEVTALTSKLPVYFVLIQHVVTVRSYQFKWEENFIIAIAIANQELHINYIST